MGLPRPILFLGRVFVDVTVFFFIIVLLPGLPPHTTFESYTLTPAMKLEGKLTRNTKLSTAKPILDGEITGPESIAVRGDELYAGLIGGDVIRVKDGKGEKVAKFGQPCDGKVDEARCGRPLGMRFDRSGHLIVADAYYGVFRVNVDTEKVEQLVSSNETIEGKPLMCSNDLDISTTGIIYWTDSSTKYHLQNTLFEYLGEPTGRFLKYDPKTKETVVLLNELHFPNGVQLFPNEESVLVSETARYRVLRYYLRGPKAGQKEVFLDGLPGSPDNIRSNGRGGFFISLIAPRYADAISIADFVGPYPLLRKFFARLMAMVDSSLGLVEAVFSNPVTQTARYYIGHLEPVASVLPRHGIILEVNQKGEIIASLQDSSGQVAHISEISIDQSGRFAYLGSPYNTKIWKVDLDSVRDNEHSIDVA